MPERDDAIPETRTAWICDACGWAVTFDEPMLVVYCVACFRERRDPNVVCRRVPLRAAQPEADRAPGEVDAVARVIHPRFDEYAANGQERWRQEAREVIAALDALRSEQGQSRDDTVALVEVIAAWLQHIDRLDEIPGARIGLPEHNPLWDAAEAIRARFGAGRAEGEDRDTENER